MSAVNAAHETGDYGIADDKHLAERVSDTSIANAHKPNRKLEAPPYVRELSDNERAHAEAAMVRKIDFRLIPSSIIMYILKYLDSNNIAAARLAGLESDLKWHGNAIPGIDA